MRTVGSGTVIDKPIMKYSISIIIFVLYYSGYEISGLENIPSDTPVLFIYYHGALPIDMYYFIARVFLFSDRLIHTVADRFLFKVPGSKLSFVYPTVIRHINVSLLGWAIILEGFHVIPGTVQQCANVLKEGNWLSISPGGVYEAQFGENYKLLWKNRLGFAKVALEAKIVRLFNITHHKYDKVEFFFRSRSYLCLRRTFGKLFAL
jgi:1-acyl-sn-glycerol-3-phosphate acyltransferase